MVVVVGLAQQEAQPSASGPDRSSRTRRSAAACRAGWASRRRTSVASGSPRRHSGIRSSSTGISRSISSGPRRSSAGSRCARARSRISGTQSFDRPAGRGPSGTRGILPGLDGCHAHMAVPIQRQQRCDFGPLSKARQKARQTLRVRQPSFLPGDMAAAGRVECSGVTRIEGFQQIEEGPPRSAPGPGRGQHPEVRDIGSGGSVYRPEALIACHRALSRCGATTPVARPEKTLHGAGLLWTERSDVDASI